MISLGSQIKVFLAVGMVDMRKSIDGLSLLVKGKYSLDPFSGNLYAFSNRSRTIIKLLYWDRNGFWLFQKRLEREKFRWPRHENEVMTLSVRELSWLLEGLDPLKLEGHKKLEYSTII